MRQLLVGNTNAVASYTNGVLASGTVDVQKQDPAGNAISLAAIDTYANVKKIRFVQGTPEGKNIFSPWIDGKNISVWKGESYSAQSPQIVTLTFSGGNFTAAGEATVKLIGLNQGQAQFERKSYTFQVGPGTVITSDSLFAAALEAAIQADRPSFIANETVVGAVVTLTGTVFSLTLDTELGNFRVADEGFSGNGVAVAVATTQSPSLNYGSAEVLSQYEKSLQGDRSFYNRIMQPNTPPSYIDTATPLNYDLYSIVAENGSVNQIKGVDNVRNITIAVSTAASTLQTDFEGRLNPWLGSVPGSFAAVTL
jgi:hypothetical protein